MSELVVRFFVNDRELDLFKTETIQFRRKVADFTDVNKTYGDASRVFAVPATPNNKDILGFYHREDTLSTFDPYADNTAQLTLNGQVFSTGIMRLVDFRETNGVIELYRLQFFSNTVSIKEALGNTKLSNLDFEALNHSFSFSDAVNYLNDTTQIQGRTVIYPIASVENRLNKEPQQGIPNPEGERSLLNENTASEGLIYTNIRPAVRVDFLIGSIFNAAGFDWIIGFSGAELNSLYCWFNNGEIVTRDAFVEATLGNPLQLVDRFEFDLDFNSESIDNVGMHNASSGNVTIPSDGTWNFQFEMADNSGGLSNLRIQTYVDGALQTTQQVLTRDPNDSTKWLPLLITLTLTAGDVVSWEISNQGAGTDLVTLSANSSLSVSKTTTESETIFLSTLAPDITNVDFLRGFMNMFNLVMVYNPSFNRFELYKLNDWKNQGVEVDVSEFVDTSTRTGMPNVRYGSIAFNFTQEEDYLNVEYNNLTNNQFTTYGSVDFTVGSRLSENYEINLPFGPTIWHETLDGVPTTEAVDNSNDRVKTAPRLLYYNGTKNTVSGESIKIVQHDFANPLTSAISTFHNCSNYLESEDLMLAFNAVNDWSGTLRVNTFFTQNYADVINESYNNTIKRFEFPAFLPQNTITTLNLNDVLVINGRKYRMNEFETVLNTGRTRFDVINREQ